MVTRKRSKQFKKYGGSTRKPVKPVKPKAGQERTLKARAKEILERVKARVKSSAISRSSRSLGSDLKKSTKSTKSRKSKTEKTKFSIEVPIVPTEVEVLARARADDERRRREARTRYLAERRGFFQEPIHN